MTLAQAYRKQFGKVLYPFRVYDSNGKLTYHETGNGYWTKCEYGSNGKLTYYENSNGYWTNYAKYKYDADGNETHYENSDGFWSKREYDAKGKQVYYENSDGVKRDKRKSSCEGKIVEVDGNKYELKEL
jgi:YD repeat-containing protein